MSQFGIGANIQLLGGNVGTFEAYTTSLNKKIVDLKLDDSANDGDGALLITFEDNTRLSLYDCARSCCEHRYMSTDDDLSYYIGSTFTEVKMLYADDDEGKYGDVTETMFLHIVTNKGTFVINTYNSHNGYYGGIVLAARVEHLN